MFRGGIAVLLICAGALSSALFNLFYWQWRDCFNEEGRCFDPASAVVYHEQSFLWGPIGIALVLAGVAVALTGRRN